MEQKSRKLPTSRKAMEYRVYWLERKLTHMKLNEKRELNHVIIDAMPDSPMKDLMHLNNEFHRANDASQGLKVFTEELNQDTLKLNEGSERLQEITVERLAGADRANRQAHRLQERGRKINKESLRTTTLSRAINKVSRDLNEQAEGRISEASYLSNLTRAQHEATDTLNQRTRGLNQETVKTTAESLKLNRKMADTTDSARVLNEKSVALKSELDQLKAALAAMGERTESLNTTTLTNLKRISATEKRAKAATSEAEEVMAKGKQQIRAGDELLATTEALNQASIAATDDTVTVKNSTKHWLGESKQQLNGLTETFGEQVADLLSQSREEIEAHQTRQSATLLHIAQQQENQLTHKITAALSDSETLLFNASEANDAKLDEHLIKATAAIEQNIAAAGENIGQIGQETRLETSYTLNQFGQDARFRFTAFDARANQLTEGFVTQSSAQLASFIERSEEKIQTADQLLATLSGRTKQNLDEGELFNSETRQLNSETREINDGTRQLNSNTELLVTRAQEAVSRIDGAIEDVNAVSRKLFQETRDLQDRSNLMNEASERLKSETETLNLRSLDIQSDTFQTQGLSQEINNHSLELNDETQRIHAGFLETRDSNAVLVSELNTLRAALLGLRETAESQLEATELSRLESNRTTADLKTLGDETRNINTQSIQLAQEANDAVDASRQHNAKTESIIKSAHSVQDELEALREELLASSRGAEDAANNANQAVVSIEAIKDNLLNAAQQTESATANANASIDVINAVTTEAEIINAETKAAQQQMKQAVADSRHINDEFMRGLESVSKTAGKTDQEANQVLSQTRALQDEIHNILNLRHGIEGFQQSVDICQERLDSLNSSVAACQEDTTGQSDLIGQYQRRIDAFQGDVSRYRESVLQFENRARQLESSMLDVNNRLDEVDQAEQERLADQLEKIRRLELDMRQTLAEKQVQLDNGLQELKVQTDLQLSALGNEIRKDVDEKIEFVAQNTDSQLAKNGEAIQGLSSDFNNLNRALMDEIGALKNQTSAVKEQHSMFQQEQRSQLSDQKKRTQNQDFELDTVRHQLENYQRLLETQLDSPPHQELQQRVKSIEGNLRQHQRMLKTHESLQEKLGQDKLTEDKQVEELKQVVDAMGRSMKEVVNANDELKRSLQDTKSTNQSLHQNNHALELSAQTRQEELNGCLQRISRLENREASFEEMIVSLKSRDTDNQQTLLQMRSAVKDSTRAMRETQKTLQHLSQPASEEKKRDWLSAPKQAVMTSLFAALITGLTFLGFDEVDASFLQDQPIAMLESHNPAPGVQNQRATLDKTLASLQRANDSIADLGEFAWPVNFGIVDPKAIEYRTHHQGISITGELGDPVVAVNDGSVIFAGNEIRGYGNMIVIQHQDDLVSIYANNQFNYVNVGDVVRRGQLIGDIGQLFNEDAAGLYFEIRHNGEAEDPFNYLRNNQSDLLTAR